MLERTMTPQHHEAGVIQMELYAASHAKWPTTDHYHLYQCSGIVTPLHVFTKIPKCISTDGNHWIYAHQIPVWQPQWIIILQLGVLDPAIECKPKHHHLLNWPQKQWYVADTPGPDVLGLPSSSRFRIMQLNCAVQSTHNAGLLTQLGNLTYNERRVSMTWCTSRKHSTYHRSWQGWCRDSHNYLHSTQEKTSSRPTLAALKVLDGSWDLPHHLKRWCQTCHPCIKLVSYSYVIPDTWQGRLIYQLRDNCLSNRVKKEWISSLAY